MPRRKVTAVSFKMDRSVKVTLAALAGVSAGYLLWKWLGNDVGFNPWATGTSVKKKRKKLVPGLLNVGNSCFMNVILQCLASCPSFVEWLLGFVETCANDRKHVYMAEVLVKILKILTGETEYDCHYYDPSELLVDMSGRGWQISSDEQDAHEFFHAAMTTLLEEYHHQVDKIDQPLGIFQVKELMARPSRQLGISRVKTAAEGLPDRPPRPSDPSFRGTLGCILQCQTCGHQNPVKYDGFHSLSLPMPSNLTWCLETSLSDCLVNFTAPEIIQDVECVSCSTLVVENGDVKGRRDTKMVSTKVGSECGGRATTSVRNAEMFSSNNNIPPSPLTPTQTHFMNKTVVVVTAVGETAADFNSDSSEGEGHDTPCDERLNRGRFFSPKLDLTGSKQNLENYKGNNHQDTGFFPVKRSFVRRLYIGKLPDCLCMHLQRLVWKSGTPMKKINYVKFPEVLDVSPFADMTRVSRKEIPPNASGNKSSTFFPDLLKQMTPRQMHQKLLATMSARNGDVTSHLMSPTSSLLCLQGGSEASARQKSPRKALYQLMSVIVHVGDWSFSGHFLAYRRLSETNQNGETVHRWICTSDSMVRSATVEEVLSCPAYMLFYERIKT